MEEQTQVPAPTAAAPPPNVEHDVALEDKTALNMEIVKEFQYLLQKSQQLFAGLRDLPPTGRNWQPYFERTFEVYATLWRFQQKHRAVLENKDYYGLKRVEIGECASKIGQLYYHYYLRTSETNYLYESYVFYEAIRDRQYFKDVLDSKTPALMIKKLRYYARFIVVCLLLNRNDMIKKLMEELTALVDEYTKVFKPNDAAEWNVVLSEISTFLEAEKKLTPVDFEGTLLTAPNRVQVERSSKFDKDGLPKLKLQEAILVGNFQNQIKFSELTLDMYRILQSLEREPTSPTSKSQQPPMAAPPDAADAPPAAMTSSADDTAATSVGMESSSSTTNPGSATAAATAGADKVTTRRSNPHKYLLYRPTFAQLMLYVATAFKDITDNSALLLYLSADGSKRNVKGDHVDVGYTGGITTAVNYTRKATDKSGSDTGLAMDQLSVVHCLHPNDLVPFTRKPLFVIVDSTNSTAFKVTPQIFTAPVVFLMSPTEYPSSIKDTTQIGSLFTLFLHAPIKAFCFISDLTQMSSETWSRCLSQMGAVEKAILDVIEQQSANLDKAINRFLQDDFVRQFFVRFVLSTSILQCHNSFKDPKHFPSCHPPLPTNLSTAPEIIAAIRELVQLADVGGLYNFPDGTAAPPTAPATSSTPTAASAGTGAAVATPASAGTGSLNGGASNSALNAPAVKEGTPSGPAEDG